MEREKKKKRGGGEENQVNRTAKRKQKQKPLLLSYPSITWRLDFSKYFGKQATSTHGGHGNGFWRAMVFSSSLRESGLLREV